MHGGVLLHLEARNMHLFTDTVLVQKGEEGEAGKKKKVGHCFPNPPLAQACRFALSDKESKREIVLNSLYYSRKPPLD